MSHFDVLYRTGCYQWANPSLSSNLSLTGSWCCSCINCLILVLNRLFDICYPKMSHLVFRKSVILCPPPPRLAQSPYIPSHNVLSCLCSLLLHFHPTGRVLLEVRRMIVRPSYPLQPYNGDIPFPLYPLLLTPSTPTSPTHATICLSSPPLPCYTPFSATKSTTAASHKFAGTPVL